MNKIVLLFLAFSVHFYVSGQQQFKRCVTREWMDENEKLYPGYLQNVDANFNKAKQYAARKNYQRATDDTIYRIRCVFHVLYTTPDENIPDSFITSQMAVLNRDFRRRNEDTVKTRWIFKDRAADAKIEFYLADTDPDGNPTTGITRTAGTPFLGLYLSGSDNAKSTSDGGKDPWPTDRYLNIWVCNIGTLGVLGYGTPPSNAPNWPSGSASDSAKQGVVLDGRVVGENNTSPIDPTVMKGRSAVHEVGHYLGLRHIWGDGDCTKDDGLDDTPDAIDAHQQTCDTTQNTCIGSPIDEPDMIENYMDYSDDRCLNVFTQQQVGIMRAMLATSRAGVSTTEIIPNTGISESDAAAFVDVYPNPTNGIFTIRAHANVSVAVSNTVGQLIQTNVAETGTATIDLTQQPVGVYYVKINSGNHSVVKRLEVIR